MEEAFFDPFGFNPSADELVNSWFSPEASITEILDPIRNTTKDDKTVCPTNVLNNFMLNVGGNCTSMTNNHRLNPQQASNVNNFIVNNTVGGLAQGNTTGQIKKQQLRNTGQSIKMESTLVENNLGPVLEQRQGKKRKPQINPSNTIPILVESNFPIEEQNIEPCNLMDIFEQNMNIDLEYHPLLINIEKLIQEQNVELENIRVNQLSQQDYETITIRNQSFREKLGKEIEYLENLKQSEILAAHNLHKIEELNKNINLQAQQLELYEIEYQSLIGHIDANNKCLVKLIIDSQPFPSIFMKKNKLTSDEAIHVRLLCGATVSLHAVSNIQAMVNTPTEKIINSSKNKSNSSNRNGGKAARKSKQLLDQLLGTFDASCSGAKFQFTFLEGTGKSIVHIQFFTKVQYSYGITTSLPVQGLGLGLGGARFNTNIQNRAHVIEYQLRTDLSKPFLIITNESQFADSLEILFSEQIFGNKPSITWKAFANAISDYFLKATRQDNKRPERGLSLSDLTYIHITFFGGRDWVTSQDSKRFWVWFGQVLRQLRYQRHLCTLWKTRLIYGFISREAMLQCVNMQKTVGHFMLRFSKTNPGYVAIGYKTAVPSKPVKNYLVKPDDISGTKKSLPDFLRTRGELTHILQYKDVIGDNGFPEFRAFYKNSALKPYYSPSKSFLTEEGYDDF